MSDYVYEPWIGKEGFPYLESGYWKLSVRAAKALAQRWAELVPERIRALETHVRSTPGFEQWRPDGTRDSLVPIGSWALRVIKTRPGTMADLTPPVFTKKLPNAIKQDLTEMFTATPPEWMHADNDFAFSVFYDIGAYFGEMLRGHDKSLQWGCSLGSRNTYDYKTPCLLNGRSGPLWKPMVGPRNCFGQIRDGRAGLRPRGPDGFALMYDAKLKPWED